MKNPQNKILQELKELGVPLEHKPTMPFVLPEGYFNTFQTDLLENLSALDFAASLPKEMPQKVSSDYFNDLQKNVLDEIEVIELAEGLPQKKSQEIPAYYFETMQASVLAKITEEEEKQETAPMMSAHPSKSRKSWALAATMALLVSLGLFFINTDSSTLNLEEQLAQIPVEEIDTYINEHDYDFEALEILENPQIITKDMQSLENEILEEIKTLSNEEIFEFVL